MWYPELELKLQTSKHALSTASSDNILDRCKDYLGILAEYRVKLHELRREPSINRQSVSNIPESSEARRSLRKAIETTTLERNRTQVLLLSFTTVSGYEAVALFNERKYEGHADWELRASGVKFQGGDDDDLMTIQEAVDLASLLRREDFIRQNSRQDLGS